VTHTPRRLLASDPAAIASAEELLRDGAVVGIPTETVYGLAVVPTEAALDRLIAAKHRSRDKGIALLIDSLAQAEVLADMSATARTLAARFWPGPLTLVLHASTAQGLPEALTGGRPTIGLRLPDHPVPRQLARRLGPIAVSSANLSGQPDATTVDQLIAHVGGSLGLVIDDGPVAGGVPSTVVEVSPSGVWRVLREGALSEAEVHGAVASAATGKEDPRVH
jgi:L-threonylcarbamoyladenylate synthase